MQPTPRAFSHIGLSVPDLDAAVKFYTGVLGLYTIMKPTNVTEDESAVGVMCTDVFGPGWGSLRIAHLATADRVGIELFEFPDNYAPDNNLDHNRQGTFHFASRIRTWRD
ncbi:VOC family protein [Sphingopyxis sp. BSNA05]|uniref:VOC family protein n=1 Tax=Sphingopyxis sp. BSNA05 TaxID=1236614 RepID=UPI001C25A796|nr:VOC family protein [Sphingopyxis sp. BSNA05]